MCLFTTERSITDTSLNSTQTDDNKNQQHLWDMFQKNIFLLNDGQSDTNVSDSKIEKFEKRSISISPNLDISKHTQMLLSIMNDDYFEANHIPNSELFIDSLKKQYSNYDILIWLNEIMGENMNNPHILRGLMHIISHYPYQDVCPNGPTMACALLNNTDDSVKDFAIKAFENWNRKETIGYLKYTEFSSDWLKEYAQAVIEDLEKYGDN